LYIHIEWYNTTLTISPQIKTSLDDNVLKKYAVLTFRNFRVDIKAIPNFKLQVQLAEQNCYTEIWMNHTRPGYNGNRHLHDGDH